MSRSWLWSLLAVALAAGCLLPDVSVDPDLEVASLEPMGGASATGGSTNQGASGSAGTGVMTPAAGSGAGTTAPSPPPPSAGAGGSGGAAPAPNPTGSGGAAGSDVGMDDPCPPGLTREQACNRYCDLYTQACSSLAPVPYDYASASDCSNVCYDSDWDIGTISQPNSIMCRCQHAQFAVTRGVTPHCYHSARIPTMTGGCEVPAP